MNDINGFTFYKNYYEIIKYLEPKDKLKLLEAILEYMFEDKEPELKQLLKGIWINIKMPLDNNKKNINNGLKGGRPKEKKQEQKNPDNNPKETQKKPKKEPNNKANNISYFLFLISNNKYKYIYINNNIYNKIYNWLEYKEQRKEKYTEIGLKSLLTQIEKQIGLYGEEEICNLIEECMSNNYKGIIFDKLKNKKIVTVQPEWYDKKNDVEKINEEEQNELENILKEIGE